MTRSHRCSASCSSPGVAIPSRRGERLMSASYEDARRFRVGRTSTIIAVALVGIACQRSSSVAPSEHERRGAPPPLSCPQGTELRGAAPPTGDRVWCERADATPHGPVLEWFADGQRRLVGEYREGAKHGSWSSFYVGGERRSEEHWNAGRPTGTWVTYFADGKHASESLHRPDGAVAFRSFRPDGSKQRQGSYVDGREQGSWVEWDAAGVATSSTWKDGVRITVAPAVSIGVPECDKYIASFSRCIDEHVPAETRTQMRDAVDQSIKAWTEAAMNPSLRSSLATACTAAYDAARHATASMGCEW